MECNITPQYPRILALNTRVRVKALSQRRDVSFANKVKIELRKSPNFPIPNTWIVGMGRAARKCNLCEELLSRKPKSLNELYRGRAPWEEFPATFNFTELPNSKANCTEQQLMYRMLHRRISGQQHSRNRSGSVFDELHRILETIKHLLDPTNQTQSHSKSFRTLSE